MTISYAERQPKHAIRAAARHAHRDEFRRRSPLPAFSPFFESCCKLALASGSALAVAVSAANASEDLTITFRASRTPEIRAVQKSLVEAWGK